MQQSLPRSSYNPIWCCSTSSCRISTGSRSPPAWPTWNFLAAVILTSSRNRAEYGPLVTESAVRGFVPKAELSGAVLTALLSP